MSKTTIFVYLVVPAALSVALFWSDTVATHLPNDSRVLFLVFCVTHSLLAGLAYLSRAAYVFTHSPLALQFNEARNSYLIEKGQAGLTKEGIIATMKRRRRVGDVPPVYSNGWFMVCTSASLKKMETKQAHMLGLNLAVFRGESGKAYIVDPYCPHLGANLAVGGKVTGECIECPFHGWAFQGEDGKCVKIAYTDKVPDSIKVPTYRSLEINDMILLWFHAEGEEQSWYPPEIDKIKSGEVKFNGIFEAYVNCHIQELPENGADLTHFDYLHGPQIIPKTFRNMKWEIHPSKTHICSHNYSAAHYFDPRPTSGNHVEQYGPALSCVFNDSVMLVSTVPVGPLRQKIVCLHYTRSTSPFRILHWLFYRLKLYVVRIGIGKDLMIWANKTYQKTPFLLKEDKWIMPYRRWFSQFYTKNSPRYNPSDPLQW